MTSTDSAHAPRYVRTHDLAAMTGLSRSFWNKRRLTGDSPPFMRVGGAVLYEWTVVRDWLASRRRASTSDIGRAA